MLFKGLNQICFDYFFLFGTFIPSNFI